MAKILVIDKCFDCHWLSKYFDYCCEPKRREKSIAMALINNPLIIDPGCLLPDAKEDVQNEM